MAQIEEWLTPQGVSDRYKISTSTLAKWRMLKKNLPFFKDSRYIKYKVSNIKAYLKRNVVEVVA